MLGNPASDVELLQASIKGNTNAFEKIVKRYQALACAITFSATADLEKSEELAHEAFIKAWKNLAQLKDLTRFQTWFCTITHNIIRDHFRNKQRDVMSQAKSIEKMADVSSKDCKPVEIIINKEQQAVISQALEQIPEKYRVPLVLFYRQEQSIKKVAEMLELSEDAVKTQISRGRKMLKEQVAAMVETTIGRTGPTKAFTTAVIASIAGTAIKGSAVAAAAAGLATALTKTGTTATVTTLMSGVTAKIITAATVVAIGVGAVVTYKHVAKPTESRPDSFEVTSMPERQPEEKIEIAEDTAEQKLNADVDNQLAKSPVEIERQADMKLSDSKSEMTINIESPNDTEGMLDFFVINKETKLPMENVDLNIRINRKKSKGSTENQGLCRIDTVGESINYIRITANAKGYVPMQVTYRAEDDVIDIPSKYTLLLEQGTSIGGFIKNDNHEPIKEAKVYLLVPGGDEIERVAIWDHRVETDSNGFWQCDIMPAKLDDILIRLAHPDYIDDVTYGATEKPSMEKLRKMMGVMIMKKGVTITGTVTDTNGQLVKNALVAQGSDRFGSHYPK
ncbi:MAG: RNA polymerase sigma factor, partial [Planctomycetota bacterium]